VKVEMPAKGSVIHVRLAFSGKAIPVIAGIAFRGTNSTTSSNWSTAPKPPRP